MNAPSTNRPKKVLITGSSGFTARYLREDLTLLGYSVEGITAKPDSQSRNDWEHYADLNNLETLRSVIAQIRPNYVIHLAGISSVTHADSTALYQINVEGTLNLLSILQEESIPVEKIILSSSAYVYGNKSSITEETCPKPLTHYAMSKLSMEYMAQGLYENLPIIITRPCNYTGIGQPNSFLIPKILYHFSNRLSTIHLGNTHVYREFNDVRTVSKAYCGILEKATIGTTINICTGKAYCLEEILDLFTRISGHTIETIINPAFIRKNDAPFLSADPSLLNTIVPNLPNYSLEDTLNWMFGSEKQ